ncbi:MAG: hypothetical protein AVDCRST_MAG57-2696, partial [uncultured Blastococcus sp.]
ATSTSTTAPEVWPGAQARRAGRAP